MSDAQNTINIAVRYIGHLNPLTLHRKSRKVKAVFSLGLVCFFWGTTYLASKNGVQYMPALQLAGVRQFCAGLCYVVFFIVKGTSLPKGKEWGPILVLSLLNFMLSNALSTWGVAYISAGLGSIIGAIFPLWLVIIGFFGPQSKIKGSSVLGLVLGFSGICVIFYEYLADFVNPQFRFGVLISLVSTWSWAFGTIYTKKHAVHFNPYFGLGWQMVISGSILVTGTYLTNNAIPLTQIPWEAWASIAYLVIFGSVLSFVAYLYALQNLPTEQVSLYAYINPIVAVLLGGLILGEKVTGLILLGVLITLLGVYFVNRAIQKPKQPV
nr:EamA-like transporter family [uncultured bacterium]